MCHPTQPYILRMFANWIDVSTFFAIDSAVVAKEAMLSVSNGELYLGLRWAICHGTADQCKFLQYITMKMLIDYGMHIPHCVTYAILFICYMLYVCMIDTAFTLNCKQATLAEVVEELKPCINRAPAPVHGVSSYLESTTREAADGRYTI